LKNAHPHIALLLLLVFAITVLPFNMLHHHAEHEHAAALHQHQLASHSCELDDHFCQPDIEQCGHDSHVSTPLTKCFSCEFHFFKHFENADNLISFIETTLPASFTKPIPTRLLSALLSISNKGPPTA
jgi:hypothetical protein